MISDEPLPTGVVELGNPDEVILRQVPTKILQDNGIPMKTAFVPSEDDEFMLSSLRERVGAEEAHRRWVDDLGYESAGTWGIAVAEVQLHSLRVLDDSCLESSPDDHCSIDFNSMRAEKRSRLEQLGRKLRDAADKRGRLYPS